MKRLGFGLALTLILLLLPVSVSAQSRMVTIAQCKSALSDISHIKTEKDLKGFEAAMTSGDELSLSTNLAYCIEQHSDVLSRAELDTLRQCRLDPEDGLFFKDKMSLLRQAPENPVSSRMPPFRQAISAPYTCR